MTTLQRIEMPVPAIPAASKTPAAAEARSSPADRKVRIINLAAVLIPFAGLIALILLSWGVAFDWVQLGIFVLMSTATALGVTVGYHRLATHKSFQTPAPIRYILAALGSAAVEGPVIEWAGTHRKHHQHSDDTGDPHSPNAHGGGSWGTGFRATMRGFFHAHVGWLFAGRAKGLARYTKDLWADPVLAAVNRQFVLWVAAGLIVPAVLGGLLTMSWMGALLGFLWGGLVRVLVVHHITWSVNSVCHLWGTRPFACGDHSRNNVIVGVLAFGEGWHNNHHAFPTSARHGLRWWELDLSYMFIKGLSLVGLAREIRLPPKERIQAKLRKRAADGQAPTHEAEKTH